MIYYHGSNIPDITELKCGGRDSVVYLTHSRAYALLYIRDRDLDYVTSGFREDGTLIYEEWFPGQMEQLYQGQSGYLYYCDKEEHFAPGRARGITVSYAPVAVSGCEYIADVYEELRKELAAGRIKRLAYDSLSAERKKLMQEGIVKLFMELDETSIHPKKLAFYKQNFPAAWAEARRDVR